MLVVAFDTSSDYLSVALGQLGAESDGGGRQDDSENAGAGCGSLLAESHILAPRMAMKLLLPTIDDLLGQTGRTVEEVEAFVVGLGPGSFTGLRIGVSTARALAQAAGVGIIGITSSDALALGVAAALSPAPGTRIATVIDAKREEIYAAVYGIGQDDGQGGRRDDGRDDGQGNGQDNGPDGPPRRRPQPVVRVEEFVVLRPEDWLAGLTDPDSGLVVTGDGLAVYGEQIVRGRRNVVIADRDLWFPRASNLLDLAWARVSGRDFDELHRVTPIYLRLSQAEEMELRRTESGQ